MVHGALVSPDDPPLPGFMIAVFIPFHFNPGLPQVTCFAQWNINKHDAGRGLISTCVLGLVPPPRGGTWSGLLEDGDPRETEAQCSQPSQLSSSSSYPFSWMWLPEWDGRNQHRLHYCEIWKIVVRPGVIRLFSGKGQIVIILGFLGHTVSITMTQFCHYHVKAAVDDIETNRCGCLPNKLYFQKQVASWIGPRAKVSWPCFRPLSFGDSLFCCSK